MKNKASELLSKFEQFKSLSEELKSLLDDDINDLHLKDSDKRTLKYNAVGLAGLTQLNLIERLLKTAETRESKDNADNEDSNELW